MALAPERLAALKQAAQDRLNATGSGPRTLEVSNSHATLVQQPIVTEDAIVVSVDTAPTRIEPKPLQAFDLISSRIAELQQSLQSSSPGYENYLNIIGAALKKDEDCVHLLSEEQVGIICAGLAKKTNIVINEEVIKKARSKPASKLSLDDL